MMVDTRTSRYLQVAGALEQQIGGLGPNSLLPTEHQLAKKFGVSRVTVRRALGLLERAGKVSRQRGRGTIVSPPKVTRRLIPVLPLEQDLQEQGLKPETRILEYVRRAASPQFIRERLGLAGDARPGYLALLRLVDDRVICYDRRYLAPRIAARFEPSMLESEPLLHLLQELAGMPITAADWETEIVPAPPEMAHPLGLIPGVLIVLNTFTEYLEDGQAVEAGLMAYRVDRVKFRFEPSGSSLTVGIPPKGKRVRHRPEPL